MENKQNAEYWIWLGNLSGFGQQRVKQLLAEFKNAENIYNLTAGEIEAIPFLNEKLKLPLKNKSLDYAKGIIEECAEKEIDIITFGDGDYPEPLLYIYNPPLVLYKKGKDFNYADLPAIAVVGTRTASPYGLKTARDFAKDLSLNGLTVVSGMAYGIDAAAHKGAILAGKPTIAVLGTGADVIYPRSNADIYEYILEYGAVISEYPPGTVGLPSNFPARNRIISGISVAALVVEADLKSGSLITADFTNEQGKDVFAIPNNINIASSRGTNQLIKEYAFMATCVSDIVERFVSKFPDRLYMKKPAERVADDTYIKNLQNLSGDEQTVVANLSEKPRYIDEIVRKTGFPPGKVNGVLTILEIKDIVYKVPGNSYALK
jgi:DNA processing protein